MDLKEWRDLTGVTQSQLAKELDVTHVTISRIERKKEPPSFALAVKINKHTKGAVTPNDFLVLDKEAG